LCLALALYRLVVDADAGNARADALAYHAPHRHDAAVTRVAVHDDGEVDRLRDPARDLHALGHGHRADVREPRVGSDHAARSDEAGLAARRLHDARMRGGRRMQHGKHLVLAVYQLLQPSGLVPHWFPLQAAVRICRRTRRLARMLPYPR